MDVSSLAGEIDALRERLNGRDDSAFLVELVEGLRTTVEELSVAEQELARQNDELESLQRALLDEAGRYRALFDLAPVPYVTTDRRGKILEANAAAAELLHVDLRYLLGKPIAIFVDEAGRSAFRAALNDLSRVLLEVPLRMRRRTGVAFDAVLRAAASENEIRWVIRDVTEERQAEQRLWELNDELEARVSAQAGELEAVIEHLPVGVLVLDPDRRIRRINAYAREATSLPATRELFRGAVEAFRRDGSPLPPEEFPATRALAGDTVEHVVCIFRRPDGNEVVIDESAAPIRGPEDSITGAVIVLEDVTDRERRERADREFVSNAAHQIRTPIAAIASAVAVLQGGAKELPEERDRFLAHVERETERLARLGHALLTLARVQRGEEQPRQGVVEIRPLLDAVVMAHSVRPEVIVEIVCDPDLAAVTNMALVHEALANLVGNAVSYTESGLIRVSGRAEGEQAVVEVSDTGPGIPEGERGQVFDRFYRARSSRQGFGLGLTIARDAVEAAGGTVELESEHGVGTTLRIRLPLARLVR